MWPYVIAVVVTIAIIGVYVWSYKLNENTKKPENCEDLECTGCKASDCAHRK